jgi:hypothetical protein
MGWGAIMTPTEKEIARTWVDTLGVKTTTRRTSLPADDKATPRSQCLRELITSNCVKQHKVERKELIASGPSELFQFQFQNPMLNRLPNCVYHTGKKSLPSLKPTMVHPG